ncbi:MAG: peptidyl-prolyl cis-trans isomerase, partial [Christensenellaceae bacterium]|nr:peptidyl-prolyl cis-trans isomerase [Christensenellaceae bacterium]
DASLREVYDAELDAAIEETILKQQAEKRGYFELSAEEQQNVKYAVSEEINGRYQYFYEIAAADNPEASSEELSEYAKEAVEEYVAESGETDEYLQEYFTWQLVYDKLYAEITADAEVSEDTVRAQYEAYVADDRERYTAHPEYFESDKTTNAVYFNLEGYRYVKHILVSSGDLAEEILDRTASEEFEALMEEYSEDTAAAEYIHGFAVGPNSTLYIEGFAKAAMTLENPGDISDVIELEDGFHIIKYMKDIPAGAEPYEDVRGAIEDTVLSQEKSRIFAEQIMLWREQSDIIIFKNVYESLFAGKDIG